MTRGNFSRANSAFMPPLSARSIFTKRNFGCALEDGEARALQVRIVVVVEVVEPDDLVAARQQLARGVEADEPGGAGEQNLHALTSCYSRPSTWSAREHVLDVVDHVVLLAGLAHAGDAQVAEFLVAHGEHGGIVRAVAQPLDRTDAVFVLGLVAIDPRIVDVDLGAVVLELAHHVGHLRIAQVRAVFLEREPEHQDARALGEDLACPP